MLIGVIFLFWHRLLASRSSSVAETLADPGAIAGRTRARAGDGTGYRTRPAGPGAASPRTWALVRPPPRAAVGRGCGLAAVDRGRCVHVTLWPRGTLLTPLAACGRAETASEPAGAELAVPTATWETGVGRRRDGTGRWAG